MRNNDELMEQGNPAVSSDLSSMLENLRERCEKAGIGFREFLDSDEETQIALNFKCGRELREIEIWDVTELRKLIVQPFENYSYLTGLEAICSYSDGIIEAALQPLGNITPGEMFMRLFGISFREASTANPKLIIQPSVPDGPHMEIGLASELFQSISDVIGEKSLTLKIHGLSIKTHDQAAECLNKLSSSLLFQLELISGVALTPRRKRAPKRLRNHQNEFIELDLKFPAREFDQAPLSLYWYGRSAVGMPLLQYLAFYQVIEFYFPIYSQSEAHRKLKSILRNPTFRGDRDSDIAKLLNAIHVSRSGAFGDERSQLKATLDECVSADELRSFFSSDPERHSFFSTKSKLGLQKLNLTNVDIELRAEVSRRIYDIRCRIVHTKSDPRDTEVELLLPFSKEADQLQLDIELIQFIAQQVLIEGSRPM